MGLSASYRTIYGVVAAIPLFLFWLYVTWCVVLLGAEVSYHSGSIDLLSSLRLYKSDLGETGVLLRLRVLTIMGQRHHDGIDPASEGEIAIESGSDAVLVRSCLEVLSEAELVSNSDDKTRTRTLVIAPDRIHRRTDRASLSINRGPLGAPVLRGSGAGPPRNPTARVAAARGRPSHHRMDAERSVGGRDPGSA